LNPFDLKTALLAKHAQHVVLIHFPIALFMVSFAFDLLALWRDNRQFTIAAYYNLVAAAIAYNPERGDLLNVVNIPFESESAAESIKEPSLLEKQIPSILTALRYITIPIAFVLIYFLFIRPVQKSVMAGWIPVTASGESSRGLLRGAVQTPLTVKQLEARLASGASPSEISEMTAAEEQDLLPMPGPSRIDLIRKRVVEQAEQNPETVARLVRVWLNEEKNK